MLLGWIASVAHAGLVGGVIGSAGAPIDPRTSSEIPGFEGALYGGWRAGLGPLHLQPELLVRMNFGAPAGAVAVGGSATVGALVAAGVYAHGGVGILGDPGFSVDAGALAEIAPPLAPVVVGLRLGWERVHPSAAACVGCAQPSEEWLMIGASVGLKL